MKKYITILIVVGFSGCKSDAQRVVKVHDGLTHIAVPEYERKHVGFDSIQLLINDSGKLEANFCYPNNWLYAKDTVYTSDSNYKKWWNVIQLTPNILISTRNDTMVTFRNGFIDERKGYFDSITVNNYRIQVTKINQ